MSTAISFMPTPTGPPKVGSRPTPLRPTTFPRHGNEEDLLRVPRRANTFQNGTTTDKPSRAVSARAILVEVPPDSPDAFETTDNDDGEAGRASVDMGELPIELVSLIDRYVGGFSSPGHLQPWNSN